MKTFNDLMDSVAYPSYIKETILSYVKEVHIDIFSVIFCLCNTNIDIQHRVSGHKGNLHIQTF